MRYFYSYGVELLGIMDDVELVLRMLRRNMKRGGGYRRQVEERHDYRGYVSLGNGNSLDNGKQEEG